MLRLASVDLRCDAEIRTVAEVFDFARDYLGLLKAALIAAGIVPPGMEGSGEQLEDLLARLVAEPQRRHQGARKAEQVASPNVGLAEQPGGVPAGHLAYPYKRSKPDK